MARFAVKGEGEIVELMREAVRPNNRKVKQENRPAARCEGLNLFVPRTTFTNNVTINIHQAEKQMQFKLCTDAKKQKLSDSSKISCSGSNLTSFEYQKRENNGLIFPPEVNIAEYSTGCAMDGSKGENLHVYSEILANCQYCDKLPSA